MAYQDDKFQEEQPEIYFIPQNYEDNFITASGRSWRNVAEAALIFGSVVLIFFFLPIQISVKIVLMVVVGVPPAILAFLGIKNCSLFEYIGLFLKYKFNSHNISKSKMFDKQEENEEGGNLNEKS